MLANYLSTYQKSNILPRCDAARLPRAAVPPRFLLFDFSHFSLFGALFDAGAAA
jgi:hypothetical protein